MIVLFSPAKLNLFFRVLHKRSDGFHEIASLFQAIDLGDTLELSLNEKDALSCTDPNLLLGDENLICKARELFRKKTGLANFHVGCHLTKRIPVQAGVGGGSSNAATMLYGCNELAGRPASLSELKAWSSELGSDVPFFFSSGTAYCTGRGEKIEEAKIPSDAGLQSPCYFAKPTFGLATNAVYGACDPSAMQPRDPRKSLESFQRGDPEWYNDLEPAASHVFPEFQKHMQTLRSSGFSRVVLTGSGSGAFCFGKSSPPDLEGVQFYPIRPIIKSKHEWFPICP